MKINPEVITDKLSSKNKPYKIIEAQGTKHYVWDTKLFDLFEIGKEIDVEIEMQTGYSVITGEVSQPTPVKSVTHNGNGDVPQEVWDGKDRRMVRMHTQKVAGELLKSEVNITDKEVKLDVNTIAEKVKEIAHILEEDVYR